LPKEELMLRLISKKGIFKKGVSSLPNHIVLVWIFFSLPLCLLNGVLSYEDHELTFSRILRILVVGACAGVAVALVGWFVILPPLRRRNRKE
jgi:hypothetical protein